MTATQILLPEGPTRVIYTKFYIKDLEHAPGSGAKLAGKRRRDHGGTYGAFDGPRLSSPVCEQLSQCWHS